FSLVLTAAPVLHDEPRVRKLGLRVLVERFAVRKRRRGVEVIIELLDVLAVIAFGPAEAKQALFQDRIDAVPQRRREAQPALAIADAEQAVLAPAIRAAARVIVRDVVPALAGLRVILAHRAPLAIG